MTKEECRELRKRLGKSRLIYKHLEVLKFVNYIRGLYFEGKETIDGICLTMFTLGYEKGVKVERERNHMLKS